MAEYGIEAFHLTAHPDELEIYSIEIRKYPPKSKKLKRLLNLMCEKGGIWQIRIYPEGEEELVVAGWANILATHRRKGMRLRVFPDALMDASLNFFLYAVSETHPRRKIEYTPPVINL